MKYIAIRDCIECVRGNNSCYGNPTYIFKFDDGTEVTTADDYAFVYGLLPCSSYEESRIIFKYEFKKGKEIMTDFISSKPLKA